MSQTSRRSEFRKVLGKRTSNILLDRTEEVKKQRTELNEDDNHEIPYGLKQKYELLLKSHKQLLEQTHELKKQHKNQEMIYEKTLEYLKSDNKRLANEVKRLEPKKQLCEHLEKTILDYKKQIAQSKVKICEMKCLDSELKRQNIRLETKCQHLRIELAKNKRSKGSLPKDKDSPQENQTAPCDSINNCTKELERNKDFVSLYQLLTGIEVLDVVETKKDGEDIIYYQCECTDENTSRVLRFRIGNGQNEQEVVFTPISYLPIGKESTNRAQAEEGSNQHDAGPHSTISSERGKDLDNGICNLPSHLRNPVTFNEDETSLFVAKMRLALCNQ